MMNITTDTQLMHNQKHAVVMEPGSAFSALQTKDGDTVFFSIGTDGVLYATREVRQSDTGWTKLDISSSLSGAHHDNKHVVAKSFVVSQNPQTFTIDILLVVTVDNSDFLYASLDNVGDQNSWNKMTEWTALPCDAKDREGDVIKTALEITGIYLTNVPSITGSNKVVDRHCCVDIVDPDLTSLVPFLAGPRRIARYYIHLDMAPWRWVRHTLPVDLDPSNVSSCFGRRPHDMNVPGIYTFGEIEKRKQLIFTPQRNVFDSSVPPTSARLSLPSLTTAIASVVDSAGYTNLFLAAQEGIYLFTPSNQRDRATPKIIIKASSSGNLNLLTGISSMAACTLGTRTVMWCINSKAELIQAYCPLGKESIPEEWSSPVVFSEGVSRFAFYLNVTDTTHRDILFAQQQDSKLQQFAQDLSSGRWSRRQILLPATNPNDVVEYNSFTTHIRLTNDDGTPVQSTAVKIEATSAVTLYINNVYYVLSPDISVEITPDASNTITVIQETHSLSGATLLITVPGSTKKVIVDPMATASEKLAQIKSGKDLGDVMIKTSDGKGERPLIPAHVDTETKNAIAAHLAQLLHVKDTLPTDGSQKSKTSTNVSVHSTLASAPSTPQNILLFSREKDGKLRLLHGDDAMSHLNTLNPPVERNMGSLATENRTLIKLGFFSNIYHYASDLLHFALHAWEEVTHFIVKQVGDFWEWSLNIAGKFYHAILDSVSAVVGAIQVLFSQIKVFFKDLVAWLGFLFDWDDIKRTHDVIKNIVKQYCNQIVKEIDNLEHKIDDAFHDAQRSVNAWAGLPEDGATIGAQNAKASGAGSISAGYNTPQANWALEHFKNGMTSAETSYQPTSGPTPIWQDLEEMLNNEEKILLAGTDSLKKNVAEPFFSLTSMQVAKRLLGILGGSVLASAGNIILKLFDILKHLIQGALESLDAPVEFPIISWMYEKITGKQLKLSMLDLICFICAIPATIIFKAVAGVAPYPDDKHTKDLIDAPDFETITRLLKQDSVPRSRMLHQGDVLARAAAHGPEPLSKIDVASAILHLCAYPGAILSIFVNVGTKIDPALKQSFMVRAFSAGAQFLTVVPNILGQVIGPSKWENIMNSLLTLATFAKILADTVMGGALNSRWADRYSAILESVLGVTGIIPPAAMFIENNERRDSDYVSLAGNLAFSVAGTFTFATESSIVGNGPLSKLVIAFFTVFTQSLVGAYSALSFTTGELLLEGK